MKRIAAAFLLVGSSHAFSVDISPPQNPPAVYASAHDHETLTLTGDYSRVDELCPAKIEDYAKTLDHYQRVIDALAGKPWPYGQIARAYEKGRWNQEVCYELKILKRDYDLLLATNVLATEENRERVRKGLDDLHLCLKNATRRSDIEHCDNTFRFLIASILDL